MTNDERQMTFSVQQIFISGRPKVVEFRFPDLAQGAGVRALTESVEDFLIGEQTVELLYQEIFGEEFSQLRGHFESCNDRLEEIAIGDDDVDAATFDVFMNAGFGGEASGHEADAGQF